MGRRPAAAARDPLTLGERRADDPAPRPGSAPRLQRGAAAATRRRPSAIRARTSAARVPGSASMKFAHRREPRPADFQALAAGGLEQPSRRVAGRVREDAAEGPHPGAGCAPLPAEAGQPRGDRLRRRRDAGRRPPRPRRRPGRSPSAGSRAPGPRADLPPPVRRADDGPPQHLRELSGRPRSSPPRRPRVPGCWPPLEALEARGGGPLHGARGSEARRRTTSSRARDPSGAPRAAPPGRGSRHPRRAGSTRARRSPPARPRRAQASAAEAARTNRPGPGGRSAADRMDVSGARGASASSSGGRERSSGSPSTDSRPGHQLLPQEGDVAAPMVMSRSPDGPRRGRPRRLRPGSRVDGPRRRRDPLGHGASGGPRVGGLARQVHLGHHDDVHRRVPAPSSSARARVRDGRCGWNTTTTRRGRRSRAAARVARISAGWWA